MSNNLPIKFLRNKVPCNSARDAKLYLDKMVTNYYGQPVAISYYNKNKIDYMFAIGTSTGIGPNTYSLISAHHEIVITNVVNEFVEVEKLADGQVFLVQAEADEQVWEQTFKNNKSVTRQIGYEEFFKCYNLNDGYHYYVTQYQIIREDGMLAGGSGCNCKVAEPTGEPGQGMLRFETVDYDQFQTRLQNQDLDEKCFYYVYYPNDRTKFHDIYYGYVPYVPPSNNVVAFSNLHFYNSSNQLVDSSNSSINGEENMKLTFNKLSVDIVETINCSTGILSYVVNGNETEICEVTGLQDGQIVPVDEGHNKTITMQHGVTYTFKLKPKLESDQNATLTAATKDIKYSYGEASFEIDKIYFNGASEPTTDFGGYIDISAIKFELTNFRLKNNLDKLVNISYFDKNNQKRYIANDVEVDWSTNEINISDFSVFSVDNGQSVKFVITYSTKTTTNKEATKTIANTAQTISVRNLKVYNTNGVFITDQIINGSQFTINYNKVTFDITADSIDYFKSFELSCPGGSKINFAASAVTVNGQSVTYSMLDHSSFTDSTGSNRHKFELTATRYDNTTTTTQYYFKSNFSELEEVSITDYKFYNNNDEVIVEKSHDTLTTNDVEIIAKYLDINISYLPTDYKNLTQLDVIIANNKIIASYRESDIMNSGHDYRINLVDSFKITRTSGSLQVKAYYKNFDGNTNPDKSMLSNKLTYRLTQGDSDIYIGAVYYPLWLDKASGEDRFNETLREIIDLNQVSKTSYAVFKKEDMQYDYTDVLGDTHNETAKTVVMLKKFSRDELKTDGYFLGTPSQKGFEIVLSEIDVDFNIFNDNYRNMTDYHRYGGAILIAISESDNISVKKYDNDDKLPYEFIVDDDLTELNSFVVERNDLKFNFSNALLSSEYITATGVQYIIFKEE